MKNNEAVRHRPFASLCGDRADVFSITKAQARNYLMRLHFHSRGNELMEHVRGLGSLQFDPLDVVGRNPDLVLQSRMKNYSPEQLYSALYEDRVLMDGFDKNMCIFPVQDFPYFARMRGINWAMYDAPEVVNSFPYLREQLSARGPLCSSDVDLLDKVDWPWGATRLSRAALESLWFKGGLILHHKKGARRYYDLIENHLPKALLCAAEPNPDDDQYYEWLVKRRIGSVGMMWNRASDAFLFMPGLTASRRAKAFEALIGRSELLPAIVEGIGEPLYILKRDEQVLLDSLEEKPDHQMRFIAPLDNLIWDRRLIFELFGFRYRWEVYTPKAKREYGYYVLPVVYGGQFVARFEPEHYRAGALVIKHWWWEAAVNKTKGMLAAREKAMGAFAKYLGAEGYRIEEEH